jgi:hypothetical protein
MDWLQKLGRWLHFSLSGAACGLTLSDSILCGDYGIKQIDEPFLHDTDDTEAWVI